MNQPDALKVLLESVAAGVVGPEVALDKLKYFDYEPIPDVAKLDHHRSLRTGFPEVIWGLGKTPDQIATIIQAMRQRNALVMATRITPEVYEQVSTQIPDLAYYRTARICALDAAPRPSRAGIMGLVSAGTADLPVAEEAAVTAELCGFQVNRFLDVGVAGLHRLLSQQRAIAACDVLVVVAGMEGALPSVVTGLVDCPVIAVPTSIGYGAHMNGLTPLLAMLNSCATGMGVVNIDNGFGAAMLAGQILRSAQRLAARGPN